MSGVGKTTADTQKKAPVKSKDLERQPKRARTPYMFFIKDYLKNDKVKKNGEENAKWNFCDSIKSGAQKWNEMSDDQKAPFE
jgi:hypothetical protein